MAGFANMQSSITLQAAAPEMRGRAMGAVALGIGTAIPGLLIAGILAETFGPQTALFSISLAGVAALGLCFWRLPILRQR
jgi:predicted MFS family arabinose efflux permease